MKYSLVVLACGLAWSTWDIRRGMPWTLRAHCVVVLSETAERITSSYSWGHGFLADRKPRLLRNWNKKTEPLFIQMLIQLFIQLAIGKPTGQRSRRKEKRKGRARDRTGIGGIRIRSDNHYTTQPMVVERSSKIGIIDQCEEGARICSQPLTSKLSFHSHTN